MNGGAQVVWPILCLGLDQFAHLGCGVDQVEPFAFDDLQRNGGFAVKTGHTFAVLERQFNVGQITQCHHAVTIGFDRQTIDILGFIKAGRDFHGKTALRAVHFARGNQLVVVAHHIDQFARGHIIGFQPQGIDGDFDHFFAVAGDRRLKHGIHAFDFFLQ